MRIKTLTHPEDVVRGESNCGGRKHGSEVSTGILMICAGTSLRFDLLYDNKETVGNGGPTGRKLRNNTSSRITIMTPASFETFSPWQKLPRQQIVPRGRILLASLREKITPTPNKTAKEATCIHPFLTPVACLTRKSSSKQESAPLCQHKWPRCPLGLPNGAELIPQQAAPANQP
ncbi:hypothetical protein Bbelb_437150 [Branchiostoma belcheri]|nr:hypothetical protein Bbelb_437150 [Branchiostoma belcheri]